MRPRLALRLLCAAAGVAWSVPPGWCEALQPWQLVRSLQLVQDRIADGDAAALPMQRRLLEMIDARLRAATPAELAEPRNWDAVMVYATGGGNPATVKALMPDLLAAAEATAKPAQADGHGEEAPEKADGHGGDAAAGSGGRETPADHEAAPAAGAGHDSKTEAEGAQEGDSEKPSGHVAAPEEAGRSETPAEGHAGAETKDGHGELDKPAKASGHGEAEPAKTAEHAETAPPTETRHSAEAEAEGGHGEADGHGKSAEHGAEAKEGGHGEEKPGAEAEVTPQERMRDLALGVFNYGRGREDYAARALDKVDPAGERPELGAFVALIKGSLAAAKEPAQALKLFDQARLVAPGTLVEEAALRRSVMLAAQVEDRARFLRASGQYVRRFLRSPYASQFADAFVSGVVALHEGLDLDEVAAIAAGMAPEQERVVFLRIARQAGIDNLTALSAFASGRAGTAPHDAEATSGDARTVLYAALSEVTGERTADTLARLDALDPRRLTAGDRELLEAVKAVAAGTIRAPAPLAQGSPAGDEPPERPAEPVREEDAASSPSHEGAQPVAAPAPEPVEEKAADSPLADAVDARMAETRKALADVDRLIQEKGK